MVRKHRIPPEHVLQNVCADGSGSVGEGRFAPDADGKQPCSVGTWPLSPLLLQHLRVLHGLVEDGDVLRGCASGKTQEDELDEAREAEKRLLFGGEQDGHDAAEAGDQDQDRKKPESKAERQARLEGLQTLLEVDDQVCECLLGPLDNLKVPSEATLRDEVLEGTDAEKFADHPVYGVLAKRYRASQRRLVQSCADAVGAFHARVQSDLRGCERQLKALKSGSKKSGARGAGAGGRGAKSKKGRR